MASYTLRIDTAVNYLADIGTMRTALSDVYAKQQGKRRARGESKKANAHDVTIGGVLKIYLRESDYYFVGFVGADAKTLFAFNLDEAKIVPSTAKLTPYLIGKGMPPTYPEDFFAKAKFGNAGELKKFLAKLLEFTGKGTAVDVPALYLMAMIVSEAIRFDAVATAVSEGIAGTKFEPSRFKELVKNWQSISEGKDEATKITIDGVLKPAKDWPEVVAVFHAKAPS